MSYFTYAENPIGAFVEKDTWNYFEFSENPELTLAPPAHGGRNMEYPHRVWVGGKGVCGMTGWRYAKVGKTVVHIIVDEDDARRRKSPVCDAEREVPRNAPA